MKVLELCQAWASRLDKANNFFPLHLFSPYYDRIDKSPGALALLVGPLSKKLSRVRESKAINRRWVSTRLTVGPQNAALSSLPEIELLVVSAEKDFGTLTECIRQAHSTSLNPVVRTTLIVPGDSLGKAREIVKSWSFEVEVVSEDTLISQGLSEKMKQIFSDRYGWILQQYLTVRFVSASRYRGVLVVDADTLILRPQIWLTDDGRQSLSVSSECVSDYYHYLSSLGIGSENPDYTFVTHHMLMQPTYMNEALTSAGFSIPDELVFSVCDFAARESQSLFCIEYEMYAQWLLVHRRELVDLIKFSNRTVSTELRPGSRLELMKLIEQASRHYGSISLHSYAQTVAP